MGRKNVFLQHFKTLTLSYTLFQGSEYTSPLPCIFFFLNITNRCLSPTLFYGEMFGFVSDHFLLQKVYTVPCP